MVMNADKAAKEAAIMSNSYPKINLLVVLVSHSKDDLLPEYQVKKATNALKLVVEEL